LGLCERDDKKLLKVIRKLPDDLMADLDMLIVNRQGEDALAYMVTESVIGHIVPNASYRLGANNLHRTERPTAKISVSNLCGPPPHVRATGRWSTFEDADSNDANILGDFATLTLTQSELVIPVAPSTPEALAFYSARLIRIGDDVAFETNSNLPIAVVRIGETYVEDYLKVERLGGGTFIEYHDRPHLHMPLDEASSGCLLFGRSEGDNLLFSAFEIPFGHAIYTPPYTLHADSYLVGRYLVVYSVTKNYSTAIFRTSENNLVDVRVAPTDGP
jgi:hypothetical protein